MIKIVCEALKEAFPEAAVHIGDMDQPEFGAFCVSGIETIQRKRMGNLYSRECQFLIRYFPSGNSVQEAEAVAEQLYVLLEYMNCDSGSGLLRGHAMKHKTEGGVLHFFITCRQNLRLLENQAVMEELEQTLKEKSRNKI